MSHRHPTARELGVDRLNIFVPALMSVGLLFWLAELARDALRWSGARARRRRSESSGRALAELTVGRPPPGHRESVALRPRTAYAVWAVVFLVAALYIALGAFFNYTRVGGYVSDIAWLLALALLLAGFFGFAAGVSTALWWRWHDPPKRLRATAARTRLARAPSSDDGEPAGPGWAVGTAALVTAVGAAMFALVVGSSPHVVRSIDESVSDWIRARDVFDALRVLDPWGSVEVSFALAVLIGLAALRCRPAALTFAGAVLAGLAIDAWLRAIVERPRVDMGGIVTDSFPSSHVLQAFVLAGLVPLAVVSVSGRRRLGPPLGVLLVVVAVAGALHRVYIGTHWPSDVIGAALIGLALSFTGWWIVEHRSWHVRCRGCSWAPEGHEVRRRGAVSVKPHRLPTIRRIAHVSAALVALGLAALTLTVGVPTSPEGDVFPPAVTTAVQLALAGLVSLGALVAWRWDAAGAVLIALAAGGLGVFATVQYSPAQALVMALAVMFPAFLLWLGWQHQRTWAEIVGLATFTTVLLGATTAGALYVHDLYYGPTHPTSTATDLPVDRVDWVWSGGLQPDAITIVARLADPGPDAAASAVLVGDDGRELRVGPAPADDQGVVRLQAAGLTPDSTYDYRIVVDGEPDATRGNGSFRTPDVGPDSFTIALSACARNGSNGRVFDTIAATDPLMYLVMGDIHYEDIGANSPDAFRSAYERLLTQPGQAALYRQVPIAYVWDDHDYGPNDADSDSPSRAAARQVYREIVPHAGVAPGDAPINQAFTIGRVRFVMTDNRSERTDDSMLGEQQRTWLVRELTESSRTHALVVWVNAVPWIGDARDGGDNWSGFPEERTLIADAIARARIDNLLMVSGDAHMVALDDGTHSDYSTVGDASFPVFQAAALDRPGSVKGGPYSDGTFPGGGQFGLLDIADDGDTISVTTTGLDWEGQVLLERTFTFDAP